MHRFQEKPQHEASAHSHLTSVMSTESRPGLWTRLPKAPGCTARLPLFHLMCAKAQLSFCPGSRNLPADACAQRCMKAHAGRPSMLSTRAPAYARLSNEKGCCGARFRYSGSSTAARQPHT